MASVVKRIVTTTTAPSPGGAFSQAVIADRTMYISGQVGRCPKSGKSVEGGVVPEAEQVLKNLGAILASVGANYNNVVKTTILLANIDDSAAVNQVYAKYFTDGFPARACYQVAKLPKGFLVEIEAIAVLGNIIDAPINN